MEKKHRCRICSKSFPCGRSLGGHMRSHLSLTSSPDTDEPPSIPRSSVAPGAGYALRENPKKTWRQQNQEQHDLENHEAVVPKPSTKRRSRRSSSPLVPEYEKEQEDVAWTLVMLSRDVGGTDDDDHSAIWEERGITEEEGEFNYSSDQYQIGGAKKGSQLGSPRIPQVIESIDGEESKKGKKVNWGIAELKRKAGFDQCGPQAEHNSSRKGKIDAYECATCKKSFLSYQALGGHRASHHKKLKGCDGSENSFETSAEASIEVVAVEKRISNNVSSKISPGLPNKDKVHECSICGKVFSTGQALGGHKRSHLMASSAGGSSVFPQTIVIQQQPRAPATPDLLDLNLPAPVDEESSSTEGHVEFKQWWVGSNDKFEQLVGTI